MSHKSHPHRQKRKQKRNGSFHSRCIKKEAMSYFVKTAGELGVINPEQMEKLNQDGSVSIRHARVLAHLRKLNKGNTHKSDGNWLAKRRWKARERTLLYAKRYLKKYNLQIME